MQQKKIDWIAVFIEIALFLTATPRWIPALMQSEGLAIPASWQIWWLPMSAIFNAGMSFTEAIAIAYVFSKWAKTSGTDARRLMTLTISMILIFGIVITPFVSSSIAKTSMEEVILNPGRYGAVLIWGLSIVLSTGITAMAVGLAQGIHDKKDEPKPIYCWCGYQAKDLANLNDHDIIHQEEIVDNPNNENLFELWNRKYKSQIASIVPEMPKSLDVMKSRKRLNEELAE